jgi:fibronectin-binding autotransporter adhesin
MQVPQILRCGFLVGALLLAREASAQWIGNLSNATNDLGHSFTSNANWTSGQPELLFNPTLGNTTNLFFGSDLSLPVGVWNLNWAGNFDLELRGGGLFAADGSAVAAANHTVTLNGDINGNFTGGGRVLTIGNTTANSAINVDFNGATRNVTVASGDSIRFVNNLSGNASTVLVKNGTGTLNLEGTSTFAAGSVVRIDAGELTLGRSGNALPTALGAASVELNGGTLHIFSNAGDTDFGNNVTVTANSTIDYDSTAGGNTNPRRFTFGALTIGNQTLTGLMNNGGWIHFGGAAGDKAITFTAKPTFDLNSGEGQTHIIFNGTVNDGGFGFTKTGSGEIDLASGSNSITGPVDILRGTVILRSAAALGNPSSITLGNSSNATHIGSIGFVGVDQTFAKDVTIAAGGQGGFTAILPAASTNVPGMIPSSAIGTVTGNIIQGTNTLTIGGGGDGGVVLLNNGDRSAQTGNTIVTGTLAVTDLTNLASGRLELGSGGTFVLGATAGDTQPTWSEFIGNRSYNASGGAGSSTWGFASTAGGFAGRSATPGATIQILIDNSADNLTFGTVTNTSLFNRDFRIGSAARSSDGTLYANASVDIRQNTILTGNRSVTVSSTGPGWSLRTDAANTVIHRFSGNLSGNGSLLFTAGVLGSRGEMPELVLSGNNTLTGTPNAQYFAAAGIGPGGIALPTGSSNQGMTLRFDGQNSLPVGDGATAAMLVAAIENSGMRSGFMFTGNASGQTYDLPSHFRMLFATDDSTARAFMLGSAGGAAVFKGSDVLLGGASAAQSLALLVREGTFGLGSQGSGNDLRFTSVNVATTNVAASGNGLTDASAATRNRTFTKRGEGTLILDNVRYTDLSGTDVATANYSWVIGRGGGAVDSANNTLAAPYFDGAVRETGNGTANSLAGFNVHLAGGVLETNDSLQAGGFVRALGSATNQVRWNGVGGGGFSAYGGNLTVNLAATATNTEWGDTNFVSANNPLLFGSTTANGTVDFQNTIGLAAVDNASSVREIRVIDNPDSTTDLAVMSGNIHNRGTGALGGTGTRNLTKSGNGTLVLAGGNNTYNGDTVVAAGTLLVNGLLTANATTNPLVTVALGARLGGNGTINRDVVVNGTLSPGNSPGTLDIGGNLSLANNSAFVLELGGATPGDGTGFYDQVNVTGSAGVSIASNVTLSLSLLAFSPAVSDVFYVLTRSDAAAGYGNPFSGLAEGAQITVGAYTGNITYTANWTGTQGGSFLSGGNDVAIYNLVIPEPNIALMMLGGFGLLALFRRRS